MIPSIVVRLGDSTPITVEPTTNGLWLAEESIGDLGMARWALLLAVAYYGVAGEPEEAVPISDIRAWARENKVRVTELEEEEARPDPT